MTNPRFPGDVNDDINALQERIRRLEIGVVSRQMLDFVNTAPPYDLGSFDGANIQGLRISLHGKVSWSSGSGNLFIEANGLSGATSHADVAVGYNYHYWNATTGTLTTSGINNASQPGLFAMIAGFGTGEMWDLDATLFTNDGGGNFMDPSVLATFSARDDATNGNRVIWGQMQSTWLDGPIITSAKLRINGTSPLFTGRITTETF
jgi:hypothetical protein